MVAHGGVILTTSIDRGDDYIAQTSNRHKGFDMEEYSPLIRGRKLGDGNGILWPGMPLDDGAPPRRSNRRCLSCEGKINAYNAVFSVRCYRCTRLHEEMADSLAQAFAAKQIKGGRDHTKNSNVLDSLLIDYVGKLRASNGIYYGKPAADLSRRAAVHYDSVKARVRRLKNRGRLECINEALDMWVLPGESYTYDEEPARILSVRGNEYGEYNVPKSIYPNVYWDNQNNKWEARVTVNGKMRWLGYTEDEEDAFALATEFLAMVESQAFRMEDEDDLDNGRSKYIGVYWNKVREYWQASIVTKDGARYLGRFNTEEAAARAFDKAAVAMFGNDATVNFPVEVENYA